MLKDDAISALGGVGSAARAIGISKAAVAQWPDTLPLRLADRVIAAMVRQGKPIPPGWLQDTAPPLTAARRAQHVRALNRCVKVLEKLASQHPANRAVYLKHARDLAGKAAQLESGPDI